MADDQPLPKKRSERLFDVLTARDNNENNKDSKNENCNTISEKKLEIGKPVESSNKLTDNDLTAVQTPDVPKNRSLLKRNDNRTSVKELCLRLPKENNLARRCEGTLSLAVFCQSQLSEVDCRTVFDVLNIITEPHKFHALSFCQALLLYPLTKQNISTDQIAILEKSILKLTNAVQHPEGFTGSDFMEARVVLGSGERYVTACKLCKDMFPEDILDVTSLDVLTICCSSLKSLSKVTNITSGRSKFTDSTLKFILYMIGKSTQEIILETSDNYDIEEKEEIISISCYNASECLQVLEQILSADPNATCKTLDHKEFSLLRCLTKLLEWSMSSLFPDEIPANDLFKVENSLHAFHLSTLVSILKVFSNLSFDPDQYDAFTNVKGLMEKVMICILKTYFQCEGNHFDVLILALEVMINFSFKCKKTFALLCLKTFQINSQEKMLAIDALLKILNISLEKISNVKSRPTRRVTETAELENDEHELDDASEEHDMDLVLQAADEDMELSTIVSFICVLLMLFIESKKSFNDFIRERLPLSQSEEAVAVSKKVMQFALLTGGMPVTGIMLLRNAIKKLNQLHSTT